MQAAFEAERAGGVVTIYDDMPLRRAQLAAFLRDWSETHGLTVASGEMPTRDVASGVPPGSRILLFSVGSSMFHHRAALRNVLRRALAHREKLPVVVLTEAGGTDDAALAFEAGARGYIPASTAPDVTLRALTFILHGGHFYPPSTLRFQVMIDHADEIVEPSVPLTPSVLQRLHRVRRVRSGAGVPALARRC